MESVSRGRSEQRTVTGQEEAPGGATAAEHTADRGPAAAQGSQAARGLEPQRAAQASAATDAQQHEQRHEHEEHRARHQPPPTRWS